MNKRTNNKVTSYFKQNKAGTVQNPEQIKDIKPFNKQEKIDKSIERK
jgi:hypothetical protein